MTPKERAQEALLGAAKRIAALEQQNAELMARFIDVEKMLCGLVGRSWSATGISIESLINEAILQVGKDKP